MLKQLLDQNYKVVFLFLTLRFIDSPTKGQTTQGQMTKGQTKKVQTTKDQKCDKGQTTKGQNDKNFWFES